MRAQKPWLSLINKIKLIVMVVITVCLWAVFIAVQVPWMQGIVVWLAAITLATFIVSVSCATLEQGLDALELGLQNFKDGEFANQLTYQRADQLGWLCTLYNQTAEQLRREKQWIHQRELMLDKVLESSPQALLLINSNGVVVFSNLSARDLVMSNTRIEGLHLNQALEHAPAELQQAIGSAQDGLFNILNTSEEVQTWHLSTGQFLLNNQHHKLFILKQLTRELNRQEVAVWKKVIRIISHELNNSLGPMSSMLHSGKILSQGLNEPRLQRVFATIEERIKHLTAFVQGYGKFAKLPPPKLELIDWQSLINELAQQWQFVAPDSVPSSACYADNMQLQQLLINLLKNAHESGSCADKICLTIETQGRGVIVSVTDGGQGMSEQVMANALIPFYSTKATGSGLGLALCREIVEAHHGYLSLHNIYQQTEVVGLQVKIFLPCSDLPTQQCDSQV
ncbi:sensor histidine kinase [Pseudoalteromonas amylolytica]|uniref:histidine kinase n=1 Tax=Pseudoalteromonas amylolytica TaxID=1859457 RepID=A0A1S1MJH4_9GAMM|nr:histidine kinase [Pseudoalteromonas sp. JW3]OHU87165.1 histidine kinase [Pseudoalteromonas amylolytica]